MSETSSTQRYPAKTVTVSKETASTVSYTNGQLQTLRKVSSKKK